MIPSRHRLLALGFYDGPTEGFVLGVLGRDSHYFKVVAWDDQQDCRLYLLGEVDDGTFDKLLALLAASGQTTSGLVLTPDWKFDNAKTETLANKLVDEGQRALSSPALVLLGSSLLDDYEVVSPSELQLKRAIALAQGPSPGKLGEWLAMS